MAVLRLNDKLHMPGSLYILLNSIQNRPVRSRRVELAGCLAVRLRCLWCCDLCDMKTLGGLRFSIVISLNTI
jgi:hypothetical protein